jgi:D-3-phosphoglycerate dehydrogenase
VSGTLTGPKQVEKIVEINGFDLELPLAEHMIIFTYTDRPGIVAKFGAALGEADINIAGLQIARDDRTGRALSVLSVDSPVSEELLIRLRQEIDAETMRSIDIIDQ